MRLKHLLVAAIALLLPGTAFAYIGPGMGAGALAAILGVIGSVFVGLFAILYYPIKRRMKKKTQQKVPPAEEDTGDGQNLDTP
jgi:hypothetical protein